MTGFTIGQTVLVPAVIKSISPDGVYIQCEVTTSGLFSGKFNGFIADSNEVKSWQDSQQQ